MVGLAFVLSVVVSNLNRQDVAEGVFGTVTVVGTVLPPTEGDPASDPAIGMKAPTVTGTGLAGEDVTLGAGEGPALIVFLAHWSATSQAEVPLVVDHLEQRETPTEVDLYGVSTMLHRIRGNWPPSAWLASEGWTLPTVQDDAEDSASGAFGVTATPTWIVLDGDGRVVTRTVGDLDEDGIEDLLARVAGR